jgi:hypothetical protein
MFGAAKFSGDARFDRADFSGGAWFRDAKFSDHAWFDQAEFSGDNMFDRAEFSRGVPEALEGFVSDESADSEDEASGGGQI